MIYITSSIEALMNLPISELTLVNTYILDRAAYPICNRGRPRHSLMFTVEGTEIYDFEDGTTVYAKPNSVVFLPMSAKYTIRLSGERSNVKMIDFLLYKEHSTVPFQIQIKNSNIIYSHFAEAEKIWNTNSLTRELECKSILYELIAALVKEAEGYSSSSQSLKIRSAVEYLNLHFSEPEFKIQELSAIAGLSQRYFNQLFYSEYKKTPKEYATHLRISRAKELLNNARLPINDIALSLGYCDVYHFSKIFKKETGYSPNEYRKMK